MVLAFAPKKAVSQDYEKMAQYVKMGRNGENLTVLGVSVMEEILYLVHRHVQKDLQIMMCSQVQNVSRGQDGELLVIGAPVQMVEEYVT